MASLLLGLLLCVFVFLHDRVRADREASASVDDIAARLSLLETAHVDTQAQLSDTKTQLSDTKTQLSDTKTQLSDTQSRLTQVEGELASTKTQLSDTKTQLSDTKTQLSDTKTQLSQRSVRNLKTVAFHAQSLRTEMQQERQPIIVPNIVTNIGNGYDNSTGIFTAPVSGVYFFIGATGPRNRGYWTGVNLIVDGYWISYSSVDNEFGQVTTSVQGLVQMSAGQRCWLKATASENYWLLGTTFSGFLVARYP